MDSSKAKRRAPHFTASGKWPGTAPKNSKKRIFAENQRVGAIILLG
jgi:hypothetical protein